MNELKGKKIVFLGDSITEGYRASDREKAGYVPVLAQRTGAAVYNYGVASTRLARQEGDGDLYFSARAAQMEDGADIVVILGGVNDFGHGTAPLGEDSDRTPDTFYGALHTLYSLLKRKYPAAWIVVCTPLPCQWRDDARGFVPQKAKPAIAPQTTYVDIIRRVAAEYGLTVCDLFRESFLQATVPEVREAYMPDGLHPNDAGHSILADEIAGFLCRGIRSPD